MKREAIVALTVVAAAAAVVVALGAGGESASGRTSAKETTMHLTLVKGFFKGVDQPPQGDSPGDEQLFGGSLRHHGHKRGRMQAYCVDLPPANQECPFTYALPHGQLAVLTAYGKGFSGNHTSRDPIVGGSGIYADARGEIVGREVSPRRDRLVVHLIR